MHHNTDNGNIKRMRTGSISGRLRTASDLEESGVIDKHQKGVIKDLIISGDLVVQQSLDKCEKGDTSSLEDLIKKGLFARKQSIDLLDGLDFDFLNGIKTEDDLGNIFDDDMMFDFGAEHHGPLDHHIKKEGDKSHMFHFPHRSASMDSKDGEKHHFPRRTSSIDSTTSAFRMFDNMPVYRGHSFGGDADLLSDLDNLYNEVEPGGHGTYSYGNTHHHSNNGNPHDVELSAYAAHAVALQGGGAKAKPKRSTANTSGVIPLSEFAANAYDTKNFDRKKDNKASQEYNNSLGSSVYNQQTTHSGSRGSESKVATGGKGSSYSNNFTAESADDTYNMSFKLPANTGGAGFIGAYSPEQRRLRIEKFFEKRNRRVWTKKVKYDVRKNFADSRLRVKGRFVKKEDEDIMRELLDI